MYKHYTYYGPAFKKVNIYEYFQFISIMKQSQQQSTNYKFSNEYIEKERFI